MTQASKHAFFLMYPFNVDKTYRKKQRPCLLQTMQSEGGDLLTVLSVRIWNRNSATSLRFFWNVSLSMMKRMPLVCVKTKSQRISTNFSESVRTSANQYERQRISTNVSESVVTSDKTVE